MGVVAKNEVEGAANNEVRVKRGKDGANFKAKKTLNLTHLSTGINKLLKLGNPG